MPYGTSHWSKKWLTLCVDLILDVGIARIIFGVAIRDEEDKLVVLCRFWDRSEEIHRNEVEGSGF